MNAIWIIGLLFGGMGLILGFGAATIFWLYRGSRGWRNIGKGLLLTLPEIPGTMGTLTWASTRKGYVDSQSLDPSAERGEKDRALPAGPAAYQIRGWGPLNILTTYGSNLVAPSKLEAAESIEKAAVADWVADHKRLPKDDREKQDFAALYGAAVARAKQLATRFLIHDPRTYYKATRENDMQDLYNSAGTQKDPWYVVPLMVGMAIVGIIVFVLLGVILLKVVPALTPKEATAILAPLAFQWS